MAKVHERILEVAITCDESDDSVVATAVNYYRNRGELEDSNPKVLQSTPGSAAANHEIVMGEMVPPPSIIRIASTFQA